VVAAIYEILVRNGRGPYNVAPPDHIPISELARETNRRTWKLPFWLAHGSALLAWTLRLPIHEWPPGLLYFVRDPWVVAPVRLQRELGFRFRYGSLETLRQVIEGIEQRSSSSRGKAGL
jgi:UDP-glucose 4-epimerase